MLPESAKIWPAAQIKPWYWSGAEENYLFILLLPSWVRLLVLVKLHLSKNLRTSEIPFACTHLLPWWSSCQCCHNGPIIIVIHRSYCYSSNLSVEKWITFSTTCILDWVDHAAMLLVWYKDWSSGSWWGTPWCQRSCPAPPCLKRGVSLEVQK